LKQDLNVDDCFFTKRHFRRDKNAQIKPNKSAYGKLLISFVKTCFTCWTLFLHEAAFPSR